MATADGHRLTEGAFAQGTREGRLDPPSGHRPDTDHVLEERGRQVLQSLGRHGHRGQAPGVDLDGLPDTAALDQGVAVAEQDLVARSLLLQTSLVQLDRQVVVAGGERLLGELRHRAPFLTLRHSPGIETACTYPLRDTFPLRVARVRASDVLSVRTARCRSRDVGDRAHLSGTTEITRGRARYGTRCAPESRVYDRT